jgi:hypothetical protein
MQRLRALHSIGARLQRHELDFFDLAGSEAEAAARLLGFGRGSPGLNATARKSSGAVKVWRNGPLFSSRSAYGSQCWSTIRDGAK